MSSQESDGDRPVITNDESRKPRETLHVTSGSGWYPTLDPVDQLKHYKKVVIYELMPELAERIADDPLAFGTVKLTLYA